MRSLIARKVLSETPAETRQFVRRHGELVVRIAEILQERGWSQKDLAEKMGKKPSEISKWLSGEHNLTLRSLAKLEIELGEDLIQIPRSVKFKVQSSKTVSIDANPIRSSSHTSEDIPFTIITGIKKIAKSFIA